MCSLRNFCNNNYKLLYLIEDEENEDYIISKYDPGEDYLNNGLFFRLK